MKRIIHWFRRDLRITDNTALSASVDEAAEVVPVYILSDWKNHHAWTGAPRQQFLCDSLASLSKNLGSIGGKLIIRQGDAAAELLRLAHETKAEAIFSNRDPDPFGRATEELLAIKAREQGIQVKFFPDACLHERNDVLTQAGTPFRIFTPYARAWFRLPKHSPGRMLAKIKTPVDLDSKPLPTLVHWGLKNSETTFSPLLEPRYDFPAGEKAAQHRLKKFMSDSLFNYGVARDLMALEGTSRLSQDLRWGLLSPRQVYAMAIKSRENASLDERQHLQKFITELVWREFAMQLLWHYPEVLHQEFNPTWRGMIWPGLKNQPDALKRWKEGQTGFPIVDAAMRQLAVTGWMHGRSRMIVAMFLTKDLHIDWREGERFFMQSLVDGEIASNNMGWQWSAGTGADAAPYFRIQNPWTQTARYDPDGIYIKRWVPELSHLSPKLFCKPPSLGTSLAKNYPAPIVDHAEERNRTLDFFEEKKQEKAKTALTLYVEKVRSLHDVRI
ncbi:MAG: cryptochrome/photolyase family protein [Chthoniobacterales bacterium]